MVFSYQRGHPDRHIVRFNVASRRKTLFAPEQPLHFSVQTWIGGLA
jgi:hypothetical protein